MTARLAAALTASASRGLAMVTSPAPARSAPRAASRAAPVCDTSPDTTTAWPRWYLWPPGCGTGKRSAHSAGALAKTTRADVFKHGCRNADVGDLDRPAMQPPRQQQMAGLSAEERHGFGGADRRAHHRAAGAVDAAGQIDGDHRRARGVDRLDHGTGRAFDRPVEARAEQRIDDQARASERIGPRRLDRALPACCRLRRVALEPVALAKQQQADRIAAFGKDAGADEAVAAVVAGAGHDADRGRTTAGQPRHRVGNGTPGVLHQTHARHPAGDRQAVRLGHFRRGQQFDHGQTRTDGGFSEQRRPP